MLEAEFKRTVLEQLSSIFQDWSVEQTRLFNKGVDKAVCGIQWVAYPEENVAMCAGDGDWATWLKERCDELGMREFGAGRKALEEI